MPFEPVRDVCARLDLTLKTDIAVDEGINDLGVVQTATLVRAGKCMVTELPPFLTSKTLAALGKRLTHCKSVV